MSSLFDLLEEERPAQRSLAVTHAQPPPRIKSAGVRAVCLDFETNGLKWWAGHRPIGAGVCLPDGATHYVAWAHRGGGNTIGEEQAKQWMRDELAGVHITNLNTRFDIHFAREWGVDFEALGCTVADVGHQAALLDDHRLSMSQESIVRDYLTDETKVKVVDGITLDPTRMAEYPAHIVAVRAEADVRQVWKLAEHFAPMLEAQGLQKVRALEDQVIFVVCEMEKNGALIDVELLDRWIVEVEQTWKALVMHIYRETKMSIDPGKEKDMARLFKFCGVPITEATEKGHPSFKASVLKPLAHPLIQAALKVRNLRSLASKYLTKYRRNVDSHGILRYALHQLRAEKGDDDTRGAGTITGRFSSSAISIPGEADFGVNIQQVAKMAKQMLKEGSKDFPIRRLHIPTPGLQHLSADAAQIQYRIFAALANTPKVIEAYRENPRMNFHKFVWPMVKEFVPAFTYEQQKNLNFATIFAAGLAKQAFMLDFITERQCKQLQSEKARGDHPWLSQTARIREIYRQVLPEVSPLLKRASDTAEKQGFVQSILGRRMRFPDGERLHKALNSVIQASEADCVKMKLVDLHRERKHTQLLLRDTVHDEVNGDIPDAEHARRVHEVLEVQSFSRLKVPILWEVGIGPSWADVKDLEVNA